MRIMVAAGTLVLMHTTLAHAQVSAPRYPDKSIRVIVGFAAGGGTDIALLGGEVELMFCDMRVAVPHLKRGKVRALAVTTAHRSALVPDFRT